MRQLMPDEEWRLVQQAIEQPSHFRELYRAYFSRVYSYVSYRLGNIQDTEDVVSEVFTRALRSLKQVQPRGPGVFSAWLFGIARHAVIDFYRRQQRHQKNMPLDDLNDLAFEGTTPEQITHEHVLFVTVRQQIATLSPRKQEIVVLKFFAGLRNYEIATLLGLDERTVASHLSRALDELALKLQQEIQK